MSFRVVEQRGYFLFSQPRQHDAVFAGVGEKDVGEGRRNDDAEAVIAERPGSVLAARAAGEVFAGDENLRALVARIVERKVGSGSPDAVRRQSKKRKSP